VLGENIGTTITAYLASLGSTTNAKRVAYAHILFNVVGALWITALFFPYIAIIKKVIGVNPGMMVMKDGAQTYPYVIAGIAAVHTGFNVANTILFLPFVRVLGNFLTKIVPEKAHKEAPHLTHLDVLLLESPITAIEQSRVELLRMGDQVKKMIEYLKSIANDHEDSDKLIKKLFHHEEVLDIMQKEIVGFLSNLFSANLPHDIVNEGRQQLRIADEFESVGDYLAAILKLNLRLKNAGIQMDEAASKDISELHKSVANYFTLVNSAFQARNGDIISKARVQSKAITHQFREMRSRHLDRLEKARQSPLLSNVHSDILNSYRRVKDHILNVAEAMAGEK